MSFLSRILGRQEDREINDQDLGNLRQIRSGWEGHEFNLWDVTDVHLLIDAGSEGPSDAQRRFIQQLQNKNNPLREQIEQAVRNYIRERNTIRPVVVHLTSVYVPKIEPPFTWRVWYDLEGEENSCYGTEITDREKIMPFAED